MLSHLIPYLLQGVGLACGIGGQILVNRKNRAGLYLWIVSNAALIAIAVQKDIPGMVVLYLIYLALCVHGVWLWRERDPG